MILHNHRPTILKLPEVLLAIIAIIFAANGVFAMISTLSLEELVIESDFIIEASVKKQNPLPDEQMSGPYEVFTTLVVHRSLKGTLVAEEEITVLTYAGISGAVRFPEDSRFIVFVVRHGSDYHVVNGLQGLWEIWPKDNSFMGMGTGVTAEILTKTIADSKDAPRPEFRIPEPEF